MKVKSNLFLKSFAISFLIFFLIATIVLTNLYLTRVAVDPENRESNILIGLTNNGDVVSLALLHCEPKDKTVTFLAIPDNTMLANDSVLQNMYQPGDPGLIIEGIEDITGAYVHRYILFSMDAVVTMVDELGEFEYFIRYPFIFNGKECSGTKNMTGDLAKAMLTYKHYDMLSVSLAKIGETFLTSFISSNANKSSMDTLNKLMKSMARIDLKTNLSDKEMTQYCNFFATFSTMHQKSVSIEGEIYATSSSLYFIPANYKATKNIFK